MKYLYVTCNWKVGLVHTRSNLQQLLFYCFDKNLTLILPIFTLAPQHNRGREIKTNLAEYFDFTKLRIKGQPVEVKYNKEGLDPKEIRQINLRPENCHGLCVEKLAFVGKRKYPISLPYIKEIRDIAIKIAMKLNNYTCVHVRRGDRINCTGRFTNCKNILAKIKLCQLTNVYIMTDERNKLFFKPLKDQDEYKIYLCTDFDELKDIDNNYYLFCIERSIMDMATKRVSTFKNPPQYPYHFSLTPNNGWG